MKSLCAGLVIALIVGAGTPAAAHIIEVTTSVSMPAAATEDDFKDALRAAAKDVMADVAHLDPVMMAITAAYVSAGRLYVRFLVVDEIGARLLGVWGTGSDPGGEGSEPALSRGGLRI